ncbi:MAG: type I-F CRISPR-associated helicase Cas3 [Helicobacteraceae bacterium 4484_230]|nr:MAG: type I-F CRISPR-associated helicase Cas3 [Helicobacteraceae bacterium 4484_230]
MMVTFVSQCEKKALKRTRRVLDSFADRIGDNTWQTIITKEGLDAVRKLLRKTASKSTAVSCHWIRTRSRSEFLWVVGNRDKFDESGVVPVHRTQKTILDNYKESDWKYLPLIQSLAALSALFHDWGKSTALFQEKLKPSSKIKSDPIRHEWISCMLLNALIAQNSDSEEEWLKRLAEGKIDEDGLKKSVPDPDVDKKVLKNIPNSAKLLMWLIVSHHRLPSFSTSLKEIEDKWQSEEAYSIDDTLKYITQSWGYENRKDEKEYQERLSRCFLFPNGLLSNSSQWIKNVKKWSNRLLGSLDLLKESIGDGSYRVVLHHARLALMLGDHHYSSQDADKIRKDSSGLFANTDRKTGAMKQMLDEHLCGVMASALKTIYLLPAFEKELPLADDNRVLKRASPKAFSWQDKAVDKIRPKMDTTKKQGFFAVNMASTGCGKTFANAKIMRAVSKDGKSLRYVLALGLRTLTLQTGDEYRERIGLEDDELAVLIGSKAILDLHNDTKFEECDSDNESDYGSESLESLLDEEIDYDCEIPEEGLTTVLKNRKDKQFLYAPVLVCTIDHLMGAVETKKGGKHILPSLRMMSSDLVIDEIDDFSGSDLIAIGRLVYLAGMLGGKVMISSATIPPDLAEGYFNAYQKGWQLFTKTRDAKNEIVCAWIDEFKTDVKCINSFESKSAVECYREVHSSFIEKRVAKLKKQSVKRKVEIVECAEDIDYYGDSKEKIYFSKIKEAAIQKHYLHHTIDKKTDKAVSFGVVRMANIQPCVAVAKYLMQEEYPEEVEVKVMAYHSNQVLLLRHEQERHLDEVLKRKENQGEEPDAFKNRIIRSHLDNSSAKHLLFIVVATPVEEVGRDHDFDWAIIEPSSFRSIVQLAGRVYRHREGAVEQANIGVMQYNLKSFKCNDDSIRTFVQPGYETNLTLHTHDISELIDTAEVKERLDATARIQKPKQLREKDSLADLEHYMTQEYLTTYNEVGADTFQGYLDETWFLTAHPQYFHPFRKSTPSLNVFLTYDANNDEYIFTEYDTYRKLIVDVSDNPIDRGYVLGIKHITETDERLKARAWLDRDYNDLVEKYAEKNNLSKKEVSMKYGELNFNWRESVEYEYSDQFGLLRV